MGKNLAQQITTTIATLVVAVAGFYFGTNAVDAARKAVASSQEHLSITPLIRNIDPDAGEVDQSIDVKLKGKNLSSVIFVKLVKGQEMLEADAILTNDTTARCTFVLSGSVGLWNVLVENEDGEEDELEDAFTITERAAPATAEPTAPVDVHPPETEISTSPAVEPNPSGPPLG